MKYKICTKCNLNIKLSNFYNLEGGKYGKCSRCKQCCCIESKKYRNNPVTKKIRRLYNKSYYLKNKKKIRRRTIKFYSKNRKKILKRASKYNKANRDKINIIKRRYSKKLKSLILDNYGKECVCCGETIFEFLTIDHFYNNGGLDRKKFKNSHNFYRFLKKRGFPKNLGLQILCFNCNIAKGFHGKCPHESRI